MPIINPEVFFWLQNQFAVVTDQVKGNRHITRSAIQQLEIVNYSAWRADKSTA